MIRLLNEADRPALLALLKQDPIYNLYLIGNLTTLGFSADFCQFWGDVDGSLRAVVNRYMSGWSVYGLYQADWGGLAAVIDNHPVTAARLQDNPGGVASLLPFLRRYRSTGERVEELMWLAAAGFQPQPTSAHVTVRRATLGDLPALVALYADAGSMSRTPAGVERPLCDTRVWVAEVAGALRSAALTNAVTESHAMIGGVYTPPDWRGQGLSRAVCSALCAELLVERKQPVLYWETPAAGRIYRRLGFEAIGHWRSVWLEAIQS